MASQLKTTERSIISSLSYFGKYEDWQEKHFDELVAAVEKLGQQLGRDTAVQANDDLLDASYIQRLIENRN